MATFISNYAEANRNPDDAALDALSANINKVHRRAVALFGKHCFTFSKGGTSRFNAAVFDAQMLACARLSSARFNSLNDKGDEIRAAYEELQKDGDFARSVTLATSDKAALQGRIHKVSAMLKQFS